MGRKFVISYCAVISVEARFEEIFLENEGINISGIQKTLTTADIDAIVQPCRNFLHTAE